MPSAKADGNLFTDFSASLFYGDISEPFKDGGDIPIKLNVSCDFMPPFSTSGSVKRTIENSPLIDRWVNFKKYIQSRRDE